MPLIEGFGDEVTIFALFVLLTLLVLSVVYLSRSFADLPVNLRRSGLEEEVIQDKSQVSNENEMNATSHENSNVEQNRTDASDENQVVSEIQGNGDILNTSETSVEVKTTMDGNLARLNQPSRSTVDPEFHLLQDSDANNQRPATDNLNDRVEARTLHSSEHPPLNHNQITIRIKYLNDTERTISTHLSEKILDFKRKYFAEELSSNRTVRLIFNGQLLRNEVSLQYYGISDGCVIHVHISQNEHQPPQSSVDSNVDLDLSHLLWPLFSIIIVIFWVLYFNYPEFFSITSTSILVVLTGLFVLLYSHGSLQLQNQQL